MKKLRTLITTLLAGAAFSASAQIEIGLSGFSQMYTFDAGFSFSGWSTRSLPGNGATYSGANSFANLDAAVRAIEASSVATGLGTTAGTAQNALAQWDSTGLRLYTRATSQAATLLMATVLNASGTDFSSITINYNLAGNVNSEDPGTAGHLVYYSTTGAADSWVEIADLRGATFGAKTVTLPIALANNATIYLLWADDNGDGATDGFFAIDDFQLNGSTTPLALSVSLTAPADGALFVAPSDVTITASAVGSVPPTSVTLYTNDVLFATLSAAPYTATLSALPPGTYAIQARAANASENASSAIHTIVVRDPYVHFTGNPITESFDGMGTTGTATPVGWYVGSALPVAGVAVTVGDGSAGANSAILGWNYGTTDDPDRALGTAPTGADRHMAVRIQNNTTSNMTSITFTFDGEVWRNYTNDPATVVGNLTNYVSVDGGATWQETTFTFVQPLAQAQPQGAVNGNDAANRTAGLGGTFNLSTPVGPGGVLIIRWYDFNGAGTDGGLALDNFNFSATLAPYEQFVQINAPTNGATFNAGANVTIGASASMNNPVASVEFYGNGSLIGTDTNAPFSITWTNPPSGNYNLTAIARDGLGGSVTTASGVAITVNPNSLPTVTITNPAPDSVYFVGTTVTNFSASAADTDGSIAAVEFYVDGHLYFRDTSSAYGFDLRSITVGTHVLAAVAVDNAGGRTTNTITISATNPPAISVIVANGSDWKYLDDGSDQGTAWQASGFNDTGWSNGIAEFGYGDNQRTIVGYGTNANTKFATTYFRKSFNVADPSAFTNLILRVLKDDHAIVYLNGTQVFSDMTNATITYATYEAPAVGHNGLVYEVTNVLASLLVPGLNVLAVEVHQSSATSSDITFDAMLWGEGAAVATPPQLVFGLVGNNLVFSWPDSFTGYTLKETTSITASTVWVDSALVPVQSGGKFTVTAPATGPRKFFKLAK